MLWHLQVILLSYTRERALELADRLQSALLRIFKGRLSMGTFIGGTLLGDDQKALRR